MWISARRDSLATNMPSSPLGLCECGRRATQGRYCADHQTKNQATEYKRLFDHYRADDPIRALYRCKRWTGPYGTRLTVLRRDILCVECGHQAAKVADHHPLSARQIVEQYGVDAFYDVDRSRALCIECHNRSTATREGFAKRKLNIY